MKINQLSTVCTCGRRCALIGVAYCIFNAISVVADESTGKSASTPQLEEIYIWGHARDRSGAGYTNPTSVLTQEDFESINVATTEDLVKYEPNLVIRRRFIGDSNGVMGIRGGNMFQTSRAMVFADGVPLHYLLQSRWNGAPRWAMVSASEIARIETLYGPYSAEYSGNAMGGVVLIETAIPKQRTFHFDSSYFIQSFDDYGFDDNVSGYKSFVSYGDRIDNASIYIAYNRLENDSQPQTFYSGGSSSASNPLAVSGAIARPDHRSVPQLYFGDTGVVDTTTDNLKLKLGYETDRWSALANIVFEDRTSASDEPNSYLRDATGNSVWSGDVVQEGRVIDVAGSRLNHSRQDRQNLSAGLRLRGTLTPSTTIEGNLSRFAILQDETRSSALNRRDPLYTPAGEVSTFDDSGWTTAELKVSALGLGFDGLDLITGARYEAYELNIDVHNSSDWSSGEKGDLTNSSGGKTHVFALFAQTNWTFNQHWDASLGLRYESFDRSNGYFADDDPTTAGFDLTRTPSNEDDRWSPKLSLGFRPSERWQLRYSFGKAYRFPIVEELFSQFQAYNALNIANPDLRPEDANSHNLMIDRTIDRGYLRVNLFRDDVDDVIEAQSTTLPGGISIRTFVPIDRVRTQGIEFIVNQKGFLFERLDLRFNLAYTDSEILRNVAAPGIEGNRYPRMPKWRGNLLASYHLNGRIALGADLQYASDSFGRNDNQDHEDKAYGAQDGYTRVGLKATLQATEKVRLSIGMDNLTDQSAYVAHPWPGRTWYGSLSYDY